MGKIINLNDYKNNKKLEDYEIVSDEEWQQFVAFWKKQYNNYYNEEQDKDLKND